jgi:hypothetical protein
VGDLRKRESQKCIYLEQLFGRRGKAAELVSPSSFIHPKFEPFYILNFILIQYSI